MIQRRHEKNCDNVSLVELARDEGLLELWSEKRETSMNVRVDFTRRQFGEVC
jgi:hypothetical protein